MINIKIFALLTIFMNSEIKDIKQFSYFLFSMNENQIAQGTGFFIKKNAQTYLVTASHNFFQDKFAKVKTADSFYIRLYEKKLNAVSFLNVANNPVPKSKRTEALDINFYKLTIPSIYKIKIVDVNSSCTPSSILCYGFGVVDGNDDNPDFYIKNLAPTEFKGNLIFNYNEPIRYTETNEIDFNNYVASYESETLKRGTSGSPVFSSCQKNGVIKHEFAGLIHIRNEETKIATILRPEIIKQIIDEL